MSTSSASSTVSLAASSRASSAQSKDYSAAFASLQSNYGLAGNAPSVYSKKSQSRSNGSKPVSTHAPAPRAQKDYQAAFGALSSQLLKPSKLAPQIPHTSNPKDGCI
ncbi:hypothetical protein B0H16DRAFT_1893839 [Mycena metata]|uniref:Uncharacterized protein n=1 Tax=Mycena metata TaxID=1033252 RepID=A0AAD7MS38_9AGAR|nr:hypothetical protein B0H16DRAFT_1893839 [Mycena metata]